MALVSVISFSLFNFVGDPVNNMVGQEATREQRIEMRQQLGLDDPVLVQYGRFVGNVLQGDFGLSYRIRRPVLEIIGERLPATLELVFVSAIIATTIGIGLGIYTGIKRHALASRAVMSLSLVGVSLPTFIIGIALIYLFAVHIKFARARGLATRSIHFVHALRNTHIGALIAYSVITETVFQWPGTGLMFIQAVDFVDVPVMSAYMLFVAFLFVLINLIVDILYFFVDPRIRMGD